MRIGVAGIGKMGAAIAVRLIEVGHEVAVWNRTPEKARAVAGATTVAAPAELAQRSEAVITIVTDAAALDTVYRGPAGLLGGEVAGKLFIEMSTVLPATQIALAEAVRAKGAAFVECPVGGSTGPARQGRCLAVPGRKHQEGAFCESRAPNNCPFGHFRRGRHATFHFRCRRWQAVQLEQRRQRAMAVTGSA